MLSCDSIDEVTLTVRLGLVCDGTSEVTDVVGVVLVFFVLDLVVCDGSEEVYVAVWLTLVLWLALVVCDGTDEVSVII